MTRYEEYIQKLENLDDSMDVEEWAYAVDMLRLEYRDAIEAHDAEVAWASYAHSPQLTFRLGEVM